MRRKSLSLEELGRQIDKLDEKILYLIARRINLAKEVAKRKEEKNTPILRGYTERARLSQIRKTAKKLGINPYFAQSILYQFISESCRIQISHKERQKEKI